LEESKIREQTNFILHEEALEFEDKQRSLAFKIMCSFRTHY